MLKSQRFDLLCQTLALTALSCKQKTDRKSLLTQTLDRADQKALILSSAQFSNKKADKILFIGKLSPQGRIRLSRTFLNRNTHAVDEINVVFAQRVFFCNSLVLAVHHGNIVGSAAHQLLTKQKDAILHAVDFLTEQIPMHNV